MLVMNKSDYKKVLADLRNDYIAYKKKLDNQMTDVLAEAFVIQKDYLNKKTFNLISSDNYLLCNIGRFIAYKLHGKRTTKDLINITCTKYIKYGEISREMQRAELEFEKINNAIEFVNATDDNQFTKYLNYKKN